MERTFCVDSESERKEWMEAIQLVADRILQQEYKGTSELSATGGDAAVNGSQDLKPTKVCTLLIMQMLIFEGSIVYGVRIL